MPNNMRRAGMSYKAGGSKKQAGGDTGFTPTYGAGDGDITPQKAGMTSMAAGGGLKGFVNGGSVLDNVQGMMKRGGSTKKGGVRKTARRAYKK